MGQIYSDAPEYRRAGESGRQPFEQFKNI